MKKTQYQEYERSLKKLRDEYAIKTTAHKEGMKEGFEKGVEIGRTKEEEKIELKRIQIIQKLLRIGRMPVSEIADLFSRDEAFVQEIKNTLNNPED